MAALAPLQVLAHVQLAGKALDVKRVSGTHKFIPNSNYLFHYSAICNPSCGNGASCIAPDVCTCIPGWTGSACNTPICDIPCKNGGTCSSPNNCSCPVTHTGIDCSMDINSLMKMAKDYRLDGPTVVSTTSALSPGHCAQICKATIGCKSVNFQSQNKTCVMMDKDYSDSGVVLLCDEESVHITISGFRMPDYIKSKHVTCEFHDACGQSYEVCKPTCTANRWVPTCAPKKTYGDCKDAFEQGERRSGPYMVNPDGGTPFVVYCEMKNETLSGYGGGWTVVLRRNDGSVSFDRDFDGMKEFFGNVTGEYWVGGTNLHRLTKVANRKLLILLLPFEGDGDSVWGTYSSFNIANETDRYRLTVSDWYSPMLGTDLLNTQNGDQLRTKDSDVGNCVSTFKGPNWTANDPCHGANPFGLYRYGFVTPYAETMVYYYFKGQYYSLRATDWRIY